MAKELSLVNNRGIVLLDEGDYENLSNFKWYYHSHGYAYRTVNKKTILMHRVIMCASPTEQVDHKDMNRLNNTRANLRICNRAENNFNKPKQKRKSSSRYKGVMLDSRYNRWLAYTKLNGKRIRFGWFDCEHEAAKEYNRNVLTIQGEFAILNQIEESCANPVQTKKQL